ncbi:MAG: metallophosphoesterase family protein [Acutalibacteraceae bacterium]
MKGETKITFIADLHHYSQTLGTEGRAYELRNGSDQKCLAETGGIIDAAFSYIAESDTDAVCILGDITNDGEKISHEEIREKLYKLKEKKPVYVITATHDWCCDKNPRRFEGSNTYRDVPTLNHNELADFYADFGINEAYSTFTTHLELKSYTVDAGEKIRLLCLNDDQNGKGKAGFTEDHFKWIEQQAEKAKNDGKILFALEHHLLIPHVHNILTGKSCVGDRQEVASRFADAGIHYVFVGHSHVQAIDSFVSSKGNRLYEINVGSLCGYPAPIVEVTLSGESLRVETKHPDKFIYKGREYNTLSYVKAHSLKLLDNILDAAENDKTDFIERLSALGIKGDKVGLIYAFAHPFAKYIKRATVMEGYKKLKLFGLGRYFDKALIETYKNKKVLDFAHEIFLLALDGGKNKPPKNGTYYRAVMTFAGVLTKVKDGDITRGIKTLLENILNGPEKDINDCQIPLI